MALSSSVTTKIANLAHAEPKRLDSKFASWLRSGGRVIMTIFLDVRGAQSLHPVAGHRRLPREELVDAPAAAIRHGGVMGQLDDDPVH